MAIIDKYADIRVRGMNTQKYVYRHQWDCYMLYSGDLWAKTDDNGVVVCELYDNSINHKNEHFYVFEVSPSLCLFRVFFNSVEGFQRSDVVGAFRLFLKDNMEWFNSVKFNDFRDKEPCPPDLSLL